MEQMEKFASLELINTMLIPWAIKITVALVIFIVDRWIARRLTNKVKLEFDANGVSIPFPQGDVHIFNAA
jgi:hypothetical protein